MRRILVLDLETVPDLQAVARVHRLDPGDEAGLRTALGTGFPKLIYHRIAALGTLSAEGGPEGWRVRSLEAPHIGARTEAELIADFADRLRGRPPQIVSFNGAGFDLPVLRYRALVHRVRVPGLAARPYFRRYAEDALDLCDVLASFDARAKLGLDALSRALGLPGKPPGCDGAGVAALVAAGRFIELAAYCKADLVATFRLFLIYELFCGRLDYGAYAVSEAAVEELLSGTANR